MSNKLESAQWPTAALIAALVLGIIAGTVVTDYRATKIPDCQQYPVQYTGATDSLTTAYETASDLKEHGWENITIHQAGVHNLDISIYAFAEYTVKANCPGH